MSIGKNIKAIRKEKGLTQKKLAELSGIAEITIRQYEAEKYRPKTEQLDKLAAALGVTIIDIIYHDGNYPDFVTGHKKFEDMTPEEQTASIEADEREAALESQIQIILYRRYGDDFSTFEDFMSLNTEGKLIASEFITYLRKSGRYLK